MGPLCFIHVLQDAFTDALLLCWEHKQNRSPNIPFDIPEHSEPRIRCPRFHSGEKSADKLLTQLRQMRFVLVMRIMYPRTSGADYKPERAIARSLRASMIP